MSDDPLQRCQELLGYSFRDPALLEIALTHSSSRTDQRPSNERLEFLGDAILGMAVSEYLFNAYPDEQEGEMTKIKSHVVSQSALVKICRRIGLRDFMLVGKGLSVKRPLPPSLLANLFEAVIAAIYLDGGLAAANKFILDHLKDEIEICRRNQHEQNFKSLLQQFSQQRLSLTPGYRVLREEGPDHVKTFHVISVINGKEFGSGWGRSKKEAEQRAAEETLNILHAQLEAGTLIPPPRPPEPPPPPNEPPPD